jgi:hypothetical protein
MIGVVHQTCAKAAAEPKRATAAAMGTAAGWRNLTMSEERATPQMLADAAGRRRLGFTV